MEDSATDLFDNLPEACTRCEHIEPSMGFWLGDFAVIDQIQVTRPIIQTEMFARVESPRTFENAGY